MVDAVQRPRGPLGWSPAFAHLGWPSDTTAADRDRWRLEYDAGAIDGRQMPPRRNPIAPPGCSADPPGLTGKTRHRLGWRGRLVLQVERAELRATAGGWLATRPHTVKVWRDATIEDLQALQSTGARSHQDGEDQEQR